MLAFVLCLSYDCVRVCRQMASEGAGLAIDEHRVELMEEQTSAPTQSDDGDKGTATQTRWFSQVDGWLVHNEERSWFDFVQTHPLPPRPYTTGAQIQSDLRESDALLQWSSLLLIFGMSFFFFVQIKHPLLRFVALYPIFYYSRVLLSLVRSVPQSVVMMKLGTTLVVRLSEDAVQSVSSLIPNTKQAFWLLPKAKIELRKGEFPPTMPGKEEGLLQVRVYPDVINYMLHQHGEIELLLFHNVNQGTMETLAARPAASEGREAALAQDRRALEAFGSTFPAFSDRIKLLFPFWFWVMLVALLVIYGRGL